MYGVVLWADKEDEKAVIWCEDHGDLAFYTGGTDGDLTDISLDPGDLIFFNMCESRHVRLVKNPRLVAEQQYPGIAERLEANGPVGMEIRKPGTTAVAAVSNVIPFMPRAENPRLAS